MSTYTSYMVFSGTATRYLAEKICQSLGCPLGKMQMTKFSDGEFAVSYEESIRGRDIFLVQSTFPTSDNLMELLLMIDAAKRASARSINAVIPYFGWARQDRKDKPRVSIGAKLVADLLSAAGINRLITMDLHADQIQGFFDVPVDHLYASGVPFDFMSLDDFLAKPASRYRKAIFLNVFAPEGDMKTTLQQRVSASDFKSVWLFHCPFSLSSSQAKVRDINNMPYHVTNPTVWRDLLTWMGATPIAPLGHCVRRHGDVTMFHTGTTGAHVLTFPSGVEKVCELYSGREYTLTNSQLTIESDGYGTWVFKPVPLVVKQPRMVFSID